MSARLDVYLVKEIARMNLDEAQAAAVEAKLRARLEEAIERTMAEAGLSRDAAERQVIAAFGPPSVVARSFGLATGRLWFFIERIALTVVALIACVFLGLAMRDWVAGGVMIGATLLCLFCTIWCRIEVRGALRIRTPLFCARTIPLDTIRTLRFQKGQIFGRRGLVLEHGEKRTAFLSKLRGMPVAAVALEALSPDAAQPGIFEYLRKQVKVVRRESILLRRALTIGWTLALVLFGLGVGALWTFRGLSPYLPAAYGLGIGLFLFQGARHADRAKAGVCYLLLLLLFASAGLLYFYMVGPVRFIRPFALLIPLTFVGAIVVLWWRGRRQFTFSIPPVAAGLALMAGFIMSPSWNGSLHLLVQTPALVTSCEWSQGAHSTLEAVLEEGVGDKSTDYLLKAENGKSILYSLGAGLWGFIHDPTTSTLTLAQMNGFLSPAGGDRIFLYPPGGKLQEVTCLPVRARLLSEFAHPAAAWSPGRDYLITPLMTVSPAKDEPVQELAVTNVHNGVYHVFGHLSDWAWLDDVHLRAMEAVTHWNYARPYHKSTYRSWILNVKTGERQLEGEYTLEKGFHFMGPARGDIVPVVHDDDRSVGLYNLKTKQLTRLPDSEFESDYCRWYYNQSKLVYQSNDAGRRRLIIAGVNGVEAELAIGSKEKLEQLCLSPDGKQVLFLGSNGAGVFGRGLRSWRMYNIARNRVTVLMPLSFTEGLGTSLGTLALGGPGSVLSWTRDSRSVVLVTRRLGMSFDDKHTMNWGPTKLYVAHYEQWAERQWGGG